MIGLREQAALVLDNDEHARVELRAVHPRLGTVRQSWYTLGQLAELEEYAKILAVSYDVWLGAAPRSRRGGAREDVAWSVMAWADCDTDDANAALDRFPVSPTLVVRTSRLDGEHRQAWWKLDRRLGPDQLEATVRRLRAALGSDRRVCDAPRVLRAIGTFNHKR